MAKYNEFDSFLVTITKVDESGMGTVYTLNNAAIASEKELDAFELYAPEVPSEEKTKREIEIPELELKIMRLSELLNAAINQLAELKGLNRAIDDAIGEDL